MTFLPCRQIRDPVFALRGGAVAEDIADDDMQLDEEILSKEADKERAAKEKEMGNEEYMKANFDGALVHYSRAIELDPSNPVYLNNRAAVYLSKNMTDDAEADVVRAIKIETAKPVDEQDDKALGRSYSRLGTICHQKGNFSGAIHWFKHSIVEYTYDDTAIKLRAAEKALKQQEELAYIDPVKSAEAKAKGNAMFREGDYSDALKMYTEAIKRNPKDPKAWNNRAACYQKLYELKFGIADAKKAVELDPKYVKAYSRLGQMYYGLKDLSKAADAFQKMLDLEPGNQDAQRGLQMCQAARGGGASGGGQEVPEDVKQRIAQDPEAMGILQDPKMQEVLREMQANPMSVQKYMADPVIAAKIRKLIDVGIIQTRAGPAG
eukprot:CAMPEP_0167806392 /NCGR_PEP_ID=MMETSP0111_2-20121227/21812_1 /TAXON_ID=91324 /ORGANISM="Lotharella globosa, Strain CCCM811" /LENGTH=377 /DNA_ID=CAMNT_0007703859 /DNA_START=132 /DNA_END=1265 /DNA_ORIENTATION=+